MDEQVIEYAIYAVLVILALVWLSILYSYFYRRQRLKKHDLIERTFAKQVALHLYGEPSEQPEFIDIQRVFRKIEVFESHPRNVQYLTRLMVRTQRSFKGIDHYKLKDLYEKIPPYKASYRKTLRKDWYSKARGIREIYEMDQRQYTPVLGRYRNHPNLYVRREAQIGLVVFMGWTSLRFLPYLDREMETWQQIKVVEKLFELYPEPKMEYIRNAHLIKSDSGRELMMRIIRKFRITEGVDFIISQLSEPTFYVREAAVKCLMPFKLSESQQEQVKLLFSSLQNLRLQKQVLNIIANSAVENDLNFYRLLLETADDLIKLKVAEILWNKGHHELVQRNFPERYKAISIQLEEIL